MVWHSSRSSSRLGNSRLLQGHFLSPGAQLIRALTLFTKYKSNMEQGSTCIVVKQQEAACVWLLAHQPHDLDCLVHSFSAFCVSAFNSWGLHSLWVPLCPDQTMNNSICFIFWGNILRNELKHSRRVHFEVGRFTASGFVIMGVMLPAHASNWPNVASQFQSPNGEIYKYHLYLLRLTAASFNCHPNMVSVPYLNGTPTIFTALCNCVHSIQLQLLQEICIMS